MAYFKRAEFWHRTGYVRNPQQQTAQVPVAGRLARDGRDPTKTVSGKPGAVHTPEDESILNYLTIEKMIEGTNGSPAGWIASMHRLASELLADIMTSTISPAFSGTIPCDMMTSFALLSAS